MTLEYPKDPTRPYLAQRIWEALVEITRCDPGLSYKEYDFSYEVHYQQGANWRSIASATRLSDVVNSSVPTEIVPLAANQILPRPGSNRTIKQWGGGVTMSKFTGGAGADVYVDMTDADGEHLLLPDPDYKAWIWMPPVMVLYHELGHVYHTFIKQDQPRHPDAEQETFLKEQQNRVDDNAFRDALNLRREHPTDHTSFKYGTPTFGGLTFPSCAKGGYGNPWKNICSGCVIATATLGSAVTREIAAFRAANRHFARLTLGSRPLLAAILDAYEMFGPRVARDIVADDEIRLASRRFGVNTAMHLLKSVEAYLAASDRASTVRAVNAALASYEAALAGAVGSDDIADAAVAALAVSRALSAGETVSAATRSAAARFFAGVGRSVRAVDTDPEGVAWVLAGLGFFLGRAADWVRGEPDVAVALTADIADWLGTVPIPPVREQDAGGLFSELEVLRAELLPERRQRATVAARLLSQWDGDPGWLRDVFTRLDYPVEEAAQCQ